MLRLLRVIAVAACVGPSVSIAEAQSPVTGSFILPHCERGEERGIVCTALVAGFFQMHSLLKSQFGRGLYCTPPGVTAGQAIRIYLRYLQDNPARLHEEAGVLYGLAMAKAYPCSRR